MNIGIYNPRVGFASSGGTETFLREMMKRLQYDHELTLYCGEGQLLDEVRQMSIDVRQISIFSKESKLNSTLSDTTPVLPAEIESLSMYANARRRGIFERMQEEIDVLSTHYYLDNILVSRTADVPALFHFPGIKQSSIRWNSMTNLADTDTYLANSEATADRVSRWLDIDVDGIVYPGVDVEQFNPNTQPAFDDGDISILFVGRLDEGKGLHELIDAKKSLCTPTSLYLVGDGTLRSELQQRAADLDMKDSIHFVGSVPHEEIQWYYAGADIFCLPSHHESLGIVNLEAMATKTPIVTTRIDAIEEYVDDGENGLLVPPGDTERLAEELERIASDPELRGRLADASRITATKFSWDSQARKMELHYRTTAN